MSNSTSHSDTTVQGVDRWESTFEGGLVASSRRDLPKPWLAGHVHVLRDLPAQPDPVRTGGYGVHQVVLCEAPVHLRETVPGLPPLYDGVAHSGDLTVAPVEVTAVVGATAWSAGAAFTSVMLPPPTVARAVAALGADYARLEFRERYAEPDPLLATVVRVLGQELEAGAPSGRIYAEHLLQTVAVHLACRYTDRDHTPRAFTGGVTARVVDRVLDYVRVYLGSEITLGDLAREAGLSEYHFSRAFKRTTGEAPFEAVRRLRMEEGARRLRERPHWTVAAVAASVGYADGSSFAKAFRQHHGLGPSAYRRL